LDNGKTFSIRKGNTNGQLQLNGKPLGRRYLHFKEIIVIYVDYFY